jgi:hypothetical protein
MIPYPGFIGYFYTMPLYKLFPLICLLFLAQIRLLAQDHDTVINLSAIVYDSQYIPVSATHVINVNTHTGDVTDTLGIFNLPVHKGDTLLFRNIAFRDTLIPVQHIIKTRHIRLQRMRYPLQEARVFEWGASYEDFTEAFIGMPVQQTLGASLGLPQQDPDKVPVEMDEKAVKSAGLLLTSPVSFFYYNFNKYAKSARKLYWLEKNREKHDRFDSIMNAENISQITGLSEAEVLAFMQFLSSRMVCNFHCSELDIYNEIYGLWDVYQDMKERGMLQD